MRWNLKNQQILKYLTFVYFKILMQFNVFNIRTFIIIITIIIPAILTHTHIQML